MNSTNNLDSTDELEYGSWISLHNVQTVPLSVDHFWSAFDNYLELLKAFSGRTDVELETGFGKPQDGPGSIVRFNFMDSVVRDRLLVNDRKNHVWKMDIPEATPLFTLYNVTFKAREEGDRATEVSITVDIVLQSENREERAEALKTLREFLPKRIPEIVAFIQRRDGLELIPLTESEVKQLAADFYEKLDAHAPVEECTPFLAFEEEGFLMQFPSGVKVQNREEFNQWYDGAINAYFDEIHQVKEIKVTPSSDHADVEAIIHWEGSMWKPPAAHSKRVVVDAHHSWVVKRVPETQQPIFKSYIVHKFEFADGSAKP
ncbi:hypothetical protein [Microcoleus sp. B9-D4]|uniref:hypothetical protein n=1 Tax=Microcoleus sp. B9-D4 TaxID=2818711 RepID=UPI002FD6BAB2